MKVTKGEQRQFCGERRNIDATTPAWVTQSEVGKHLPRAASTLEKRKTVPPNFSNDERDLYHAVKSHVRS